jgi:hypothetical protein
MPRSSANLVSRDLGHYEKRKYRKTLIPGKRFGLLEPGVAPEPCVITTPEVKGDVASTNSKRKRVGRSTTAIPARRPRTRAETKRQSQRDRLALTLLAARTAPTDCKFVLVTDGNGNIDPNTDCTILTSTGRPLQTIYRSMSEKRTVPTDVCTFSQAFKYVMQTAQEQTSTDNRYQYALSRGQHDMVNNRVREAWKHELRCWHCTLLITSRDRVRTCPVAYDRAVRTYKCVGFFCSWACAWTCALWKTSAKFMSRSMTPSVELVRYFFNVVTSPTGEPRDQFHMPSAPPKEVLIEYGGCMSRDQYRRIVSSSEPEGNIRFETNLFRAGGYMCVPFDYWTYVYDCVDKRAPLNAAIDSTTGPTGVLNIQKDVPIRPGANARSAAALASAAFVSHVAKTTAVATRHVPAPILGNVPVRVLEQQQKLERQKMRQAHERRQEEQDAALKSYFVPASPAVLTLKESPARHPC